MSGRSSSIPTHPLTWASKRTLQADYAEHFPLAMLSFSSGLLTWSTTLFLHLWDRATSGTTLKTEVPGPDRSHQENIRSARSYALVHHAFPFISFRLTWFVCVGEKSGSNSFPSESERRLSKQCRTHNEYG